MHANAAPRPRIGVVLVGASDLSGGGGAERYFADLFLAWRKSDVARGCELWLITDSRSRHSLASVGRNLGVERVIELPGTGKCWRLRQAFELRRLATSGRFDVLHLTLALPRHLPWLWSLARRARRARISVNINDYEVAQRLEAGREPRGFDLGWRCYLAYFGCRDVDGFFVWYRRLVPSLRRLRKRLPTVVHAADSCFVDTCRFAPAPRKRREVVFAGRLMAIKRPKLFVEAVAVARDRAPELVDAWRFRMLGKGPLEGELRQLVAETGLAHNVSIEFAPYAADVFAGSSVYVSTQDEENFTSLAMLEAMACGNAVIARDVGQTRAFVRDGENGLLLADDRPDTLASALLQLMADPAVRERMAAESRRITLEEHYAGRVLDEFDAFWRLITEHER